ncbi:unnamed protein product, partial [Polarella glacialis]
VVTLSLSGASSARELAVALAAATEGCCSELNFDDNNNNSNSNNNNSNNNNNNNNKNNNNNSNNSNNSNNNEASDPQAALLQIKRAMGRTL